MANIPMNPTKNTMVKQWFWGYGSTTGLTIWLVKQKYTQHMVEPHQKKHSATIFLAIGAYDLTI